jgi:hypothetical protein
LVTDDTPSGFLGVVDTVEVALLSGHRDLGYGMQRFDELAGIYYDSFTQTNN